LILPVENNINLAKKNYRFYLLAFLHIKQTREKRGKTAFANQRKNPVICLKIFVELEYP